MTQHIVLYFGYVFRNFLAEGVQLIFQTHLQTKFAQNLLILILDVKIGIYGANGGRFEPHGLPP